MNETSVNIESEQHEELRPMMALVFYGRSNGAKAVSKHTIVNGRLSAGQPISLIQVRNNIEKIMDKGTSNNPQSFITNHRVLFENNKLLIWYKPTEKRPMWFASGANRTSFNANWPNLIFVFDKVKRSLKVGALAVGTRPCEDTIVYHPPLMNISNSLVLCQGSAKLPEKVTAKNLETIENTLFDSWFSHRNCNEVVKGISSDKELIAWWQGKEHTKVKASELYFWGRVSDFMKGAV